MIAFDYGGSAANRYSIEIASDFIAWSTFPVDPDVALKTQAIMWPVPLAKATYAMLKSLVVQDYNTIAGVLGLQDPKPSQSLEQLLGRHAKMFPIDSNNAAGVSLQPKPRSANAKEVSKDDTEAQVQEWLDSLAQAWKNKLDKAAMAFSGTLSKHYKPVKKLPPRGSIIVSGLVEIDAPNAWLVIDVRAAYQPKERVFHPGSMVVKVRRIQPKKQAAQGGLV